MNCIKGSLTNVYVYKYISYRIEKYIIKRHNNNSVTPNDPFHNYTSSINIPDSIAKVITHLTSLQRFGHCKYLRGFSRMEFSNQTPLAERKDISPTISMNFSTYRLLLLLLLLLFLMSKTYL